VKHIGDRKKSWRTPPTVQLSVFRRYTSEGQSGSVPLQYSGRSQEPVASLHSVEADFSCLFAYAQSATNSVIRRHCWFYCKHSASCTADRNVGIACWQWIGLF